MIEKENTFCFITNSQKVSVKKDPFIIWQIQSYDKAKELLIKGECKVHSNVSIENLELFLNCLVDKNAKIPSNKLTAEVYSDFNQLTNEFNITKKFITLDQLNPLDKINCSETIVECKTKLKDKTYFENEISKNLDFYLDKYAHELYFLPIESLYNIFYNKDRKLISQEKAYRFITKTLIKDNDDKNEDSLYILLKSIDGDKLFNESPELLIQSIVSLQLI